VVNSLVAIHLLFTPSNKLRFDLTNLRNLAVLDSDVGLISRQTSAIDYHATSYDRIEFRHFGFS
jgi:hypothetical protein